MSKNKKPELTPRVKEILEAKLTEFREKERSLSVKAQEAQADLEKTRESIAEIEELLG